LLPGEQSVSNAHATAWTLESAKANAASPQTFELTFMVIPTPRANGFGLAGSQVDSGCSFLGLPQGPRSTKASRTPRWCFSSPYRRDIDPEPFVARFRAVRNGGIPSSRQWPILIRTRLISISSISSTSTQARLRTKRRPLLESR
jgi:hypothetical protein